MYLISMKINDISKSISSSTDFLGHRITDVGKTGSTAVSVDTYMRTKP